MTKDDLMTTQMSSLATSNLSLDFVTAFKRLLLKLWNFVNELYAINKRMHSKILVKEKPSRVDLIVNEGHDYNDLVKIGSNHGGYLPTI